MGNERGMILFASLTILCLLMAAGVGVIVSTQNDSKVTANLRGGTETFYVAEAGIAWGKEQLSRAANNPPVPADSSQSFSAGNFEVSFLSPIRVSSLVARVVVRSVGMRGTSSQVIQSRLTKTYDIADAAVSLKGNSRANFVGNLFFLSGLDHDPANGQVVSAATARPGIAVSGQPVLTQVWDGLSSEQRANITGDEASGSAISISDFLPGSVVAKLGEELCNAPNALKQPIPADGALSLIGLTWGSALTPQLRCIDGLSGPADSVTLSGGSTGAGILVVRNADLVVNGAFRWEGLMIVTGENVALRVAGGESKEIYGSVVINEINPAIESGRSTLDVQGVARVRYSRAALARAAELIPTSSLDSVYSFLPATITQDYWRTLAP